MNDENSSLNTKLPIFDINNWNRWMIQMRVLFGTQDVLNLANDNYTNIAAYVMEAQRNAHRET